MPETSIETVIAYLNSREQTDLAAYLTTINAGVSDLLTQIVESGLDQSTSTPVGNTDLEIILGAATIIRKMGG